MLFESPRDPHIVMLPLAYHQWPTFGWLLRIGHRNRSDGPLRYFMASQGVWYAVIGWAAGMMTNIHGDGLFVCWIFHWEEAQTYDQHNY
jgi:hypothetical protein